MLGHINAQLLCQPGHAFFRHYYHRVVAEGVDAGVPAAACIGVEISPIPMLAGQVAGLGQDAEFAKALTEAARLQAEYGGCCVQGAVHRLSSCSSAAHALDQCQNVVIELLMQALDGSVVVHYPVVVLNPQPLFCAVGTDRGSRLADQVDDHAAVLADELGLVLRP